mmetsp:Transcript_148806/g.370786  ORF Transcript_148806/g.370786 Transcript_148806/m.370786 type:complete len:227 (+) Transcript_148806:113-793(+)
MSSAPGGVLFDVAGERLHVCPSDFVDLDAILVDLVQRHCTYPFSLHDLEPILILVTHELDKIHPALESLTQLLDLRIHELAGAAPCGGKADHQYIGVTGARRSDGVVQEGLVLARLHRPHSMAEEPPAAGCRRRGGGGKRGQRPRRGSPHCRRQLCTTSGCRPQTCGGTEAEQDGEKAGDNSGWPFRRHPCVRHAGGRGGGAGNGRGRGRGRGRGLGGARVGEAAA